MAYCTLTDIKKLIPEEVLIDLTGGGKEALG
jgi:hypothetical protein